MNPFLKRILSEAPGSQTVSFGDQGVRNLHDFRQDIAAFQERIGQVRAAKNTIVLAFENDRYAFAVALLGAWAQGLHVALPPNTRPQTIEQICATVHSEQIAHDGILPHGINLKAWLDNTARTQITHRPNREPLAYRWQDDKTIVTLFSSGTSSGTPQAAPKTVTQLFSEARMLAETFFPPHAKVVSTVHPGHIYGLLYSVLAPLLADGSFGRETPFFPSSIGRDVRTYQADVLVTVPAHLTTFEGIAVEDLQSVQRLLSSTAPLGEELARKIHAQFALEVTEVLGSSETGGMAMRQVVREPRWKALPGVSLRVDDDARLWVDSPYICTTESRPFLTQERVRLEGEHFVHEGRWDRIVKIGGRRVSLPAMEAHLLRHPSIKDAAILVEDTQDLHAKRLHLAVVDPRQDKQAILQHLDERFERSTWPRRIVFVDQLPRESNGKLQNHRLKALFAENKNAAKNVQPNTQDIRWDEPSPREEGMPSVQYTLHIPHDYRWFKGHFDEHPLMAAAAQMHDIVAPAIQKHLGKGHVSRVLRIKFQREIKPGDHLQIQLQGEADALDFSILRDNARCTTGRLVWECDA